MIGYSKKSTSMQVIEDPSVEQWDAILSESESPTFHHTKAWANIIAASFPDCNIRTEAYLFDDGQEALLPLVEFPYLKSTMNAYFASYAGYYGGLISKGGLSVDKIDLILDRFMRLNVACIYINHGPLNSMELPGRLVRSADFTHLLSLSEDFDFVWEKVFHNKHRTNVRRAEKAGVKVIDGRKNEDDIEVFYNLYKKAAVRWGEKATWIRPYEFCKNSILFGGDNTIFKLALLDEKVIGGVVTHFYRDHAYYSLSAFDYDYRSYRASNLMLNEVVREACLAGNKHFDLGASAGLTGVIQFKESVGGVRTVLDSYTWENPLYKTYKGLRRRISND